MRHIDLQCRLRTLPAACVRRAEYGFTAGRSMPQLWGPECRGCLMQSPRDNDATTVNVAMLSSSACMTILCKYVGSLRGFSKVNERGDGCAGCEAATRQEFSSHMPERSRALCQVFTPCFVNSKHLPRLLKLVDNFPFYLRSTDLEQPSFPLDFLECAIPVVGAESVRYKLGADAFSGRLQP